MNENSAKCLKQFEKTDMIMSTERNIVIKEFRKQTLNYVIERDFVFKTKKEKKKTI